MFLWVLFLHNYIIPQKGCILSFSGCSLFFYSAFSFPLIHLMCIDNSNQIVYNRANFKCIG